MAVLSQAEVLARRNEASLLCPTVSPRSVADIVGWFGAMQAQEVGSGQWSLGLRMADSRESDVVAALERKEAVRTWPMRGTVHLVPARDARWMLDLMGAKALAGAPRRRENIGLPTETADAAVSTLASALAGGRRLTRAECLGVLDDAGLRDNPQWSYHLLWYASQLGVTCIAPHADGEQTFALLDEWVPDPHTPSRDEALSTMALRYFRSHGPVPLPEMARWTGLGIRDCRAGVAATGEVLRTVETGLGPMVATAASLDAGSAPIPPVRVLPGFDEYLLGYGDRALIMEPEHMGAVCPGNNGVFRATVVVRGRVAATWKKTVSTKKARIDVAPIADTGIAIDRDEVSEAFVPYGHFISKTIDLRWT